MNTKSLINQVVDFYRTYLSCSRDQLDLLALWTFHTHCCRNAPFSPALNIHSRHKQSGKTTCLELLEMLCHDPWFHTSPSPALVIRQTQGLDSNHPFTGTLLLDECRLTASLQGVLCASFRWSGRQAARSKNHAGESVFDQRVTFFPKAFAGNHRLPDCLRDVSIPIGLEPKQPGSPCRRFHQDPNRQFAASLRTNLRQWYEDHAEILVKMPTYEGSQFPPELSSRQQDCAEPLLIIADLIGGEWPQRAREALISTFALSAFEDFYSSKQVLGDIQNAFLAKDHPEWISSKDLLEFLNTLDDRTWDEWSKGKPLTSKDLAALLAPFGIKSKNHRTGEDDKVAKGYNRQDFLTSWQKYLPETCGTAAPGCGEDTQGSPVSVAAELQNFGQASPEARTGNPKSTNPVPTQPRPAAVLSCQAKDSSQKPAANSVAANLQNQQCGTAAPGCGEDTQGAHVSVAANSQNSSPSHPTQDAVPRSEPTAPAGKITTVIAGEQFSFEAAEYQKRRYSDPLREASMRAIEKALNQ